MNGGSIEISELEDSSFGDEFEDDVDSLNLDDI